MERKYPQGTSFRCNSHQYQQIISCGACLNCVTSNNSKLYCTQSKTLTYGIWILAEIKWNLSVLLPKKVQRLLVAEMQGRRISSIFIYLQTSAFCVMLIVRKVSLYHKKLRDYCQRTFFFFFYYLLMFLSTIPSLLVSLQILHFIHPDPLGSTITMHFRLSCFKFSTTLEN